MKQKPELSIIVPVYNVEEYLDRCIRSVLRQSFNNFELLLIDDGSEDRSGRICDLYADKDSRVRVLHKENEGVSIARNMGMMMARAEYIAFVDADDELDGQMYQKLMEEMRKPEPDIVFCRFYTFTDAGDKQYCYEENLGKVAQHPAALELFLVEKKYEKKGNTLIKDNVFGSVCRSIFKSEIIQTYNIRFVPQIRLAEDLLFLMEYCNYCKRGCVVDEYLYHYYVSRNTSAVSGYSGGYRPFLYKNMKATMTKKEEIIRSNTYMDDKRREALIQYIKYNFFYDVLYNEMVFNEAAIDELKLISEDRFFCTLLTGKTFSIMKKNGESRKKRLIILLGRLRCWNILQVIFKRYFSHCKK